MHRLLAICIALTCAAPVAAQHDGHWELSSVPPATGGTSTKENEGESIFGDGWVMVLAKATPLGTNDTRAFATGYSDYAPAGVGTEKSGEKYEAWTWTGGEHDGWVGLDIETDTGGGLLWHNGEGNASQTLTTEILFTSSVTDELYVATMGTISTSGAGTRFVGVKGLPIPIPNPGMGVFEKELAEDIDRDGHKGCANVVWYQCKSKSTSTASIDGPFVGMAEIEGHIDAGHDRLRLMLSCCGGDLRAEGGWGLLQEMAMDDYYEALDRHAQEELEGGGSAGAEIESETAAE